MFFTMHYSIKSPISTTPMINNPLDKGSSLPKNTLGLDKPILRFGMISRIQEKTYCFSCNK